MTQRIDAPGIMAKEAAAAIEIGSLVKLDSTGKAAKATASDKAIGSVIVAAPAAGDTVVIKLKGNGSHRVRVDGAIAIQADVFTAADGEGASTGTNLFGVAGEASGAANDIIEVFPV